MNENDFKRALYLTSVIRSPSQRIHTFWQTRFRYFMVSSREEVAMLRTGYLECSKPAIITPDTFAKTFEGFSKEAVQFAEENFKQVLQKIKVLGYQFQNKFEKEQQYTISTEQLISNIVEDVSETTTDTAILRAPDDIWALSLMKVAFEAIQNSAPGNFQDLNERGYFKTTEEKIKDEIEMLFTEAAADKSYVQQLGRKLQEYNMFEKYEDRFYKLL